MGKRNDVVAREAQRQALKDAYGITPAENTKHYDAAFLRWELGQLALIAEIPPNNLNAFLADVADCVYMLEAMLEVDRIVEERRPAISEFVKASGRMLRAIDGIQKYEKTEPEPGDVGSHFSMWFGLYANVLPTQPPIGQSLASIKRALAYLHDKTKDLLTSKPKSGERRTTICLRGIYEAAKKHGGKLTYDKKTGRGNLTEVMEFLSELEGWQDLSPSTLDRIVFPS